MAYAVTISIVAKTRAGVTGPGKPPATARNTTTAKPKYSVP